MICEKCNQEWPDFKSWHDHQCKPQAQSEQVLPGLNVIVDPNEPNWRMEIHDYGGGLKPSPSEPFKAFDRDYYINQLEGKDRQIAKLTAEKQEALTNYWEVLEQFQKSSSEAHQLKAQVDELRAALSRAFQTIDYWEEFGDTSKMTEGLDDLRAFAIRQKGE